MRNLRIPWNEGLGGSPLGPLPGSFGTHVRGLLSPPCPFIAASQCLIPLQRKPRFSEISKKLNMPVTFHLYVRNLAPEVTSEDLSEHFAAVGPVKRAFLAYPKGATSGVHRGFGFVLFALEADAQRAVAELSGSIIKGQAIKIDLALTKQSSKETVSRTHPTETQSFDKDSSILSNSEKNEVILDPIVARHPSVGPSGAAAGRPGRLIVRNLPFNCTQDVLRSVFAEFGALIDVHVVTTSGRDGKSRCKGFAFVEFKTRSEGKTAVARATGVNVLGRPIAVDFAMGKREYCEKVGKEVPAEKNTAALITKDIASTHAEHQRISDNSTGSTTAVKRSRPDVAATVKTEDERQDELERTVFVRNIR
jgi:nucleolar protein 4